MGKRIPWGELPRVAVFEVSRLARASQPKTGPFHFPPMDIPERSAAVWAIDQSGAGQAGVERKERFKSLFEGFARSGSSGSGASAEGEPWASFVSSERLVMLPLDDAGMSPEQIIAKEELDWERVRGAVERWAAEEFPAGHFLLSAPESKTRFDESERMLRELSERRWAFEEARQIAAGVKAAAPGKSAPSI